MSERPRILIVDDEPLNVNLLEQELEPLGCKTTSASDGEEALETIAHGFPGIVVSDIKMPRMDGLTLMQRAKEIDPEMPVILVSAHGDIAMAVQAMRDGAYDFIERPYDAERLREMVERALTNRALVLDNRALRAELVARSGLDARILGDASSMVELRRTIAQIADTDANVLIRGDTGTGKELVARSLHELSSRSGHHFVPLNCGAMPEGLFESELFGHEPGAFTGATKRRLGKLEHAHKGTLFLDEIESMPTNLQVKLLRVIQEREIERLGSNESVPTEFRLVAASQSDLTKAIERKEFRQDLYFRLNVAELNIPPLRDRREDIPLLFGAFLNELAARYERDVPALASGDIQELMAHDWPGNVRELRNIAERYILGLKGKKGGLSELISGPELTPPALRDQLDIFEKCILEQELARNDGNVQATSKALGIPMRTLNDRMRRHDLSRKDYE